MATTDPPAHERPSERPTFVASEDEARLLHQIAVAREVIKAALPPEKKASLWDRPIAGVALGGFIAVMGAWCSESASIKDKREERAQSLQEIARKERLDVALQVQRQVAAILAGCDKLVIIGQGRFDGAVPAGAAMSDAASQATENWRRESEALNLSVRLYYGEERDPIKAWRVVQTAVNEYVESTEAFYMAWRAGTFARDTTARGTNNTRCAEKRARVVDALVSFGSSVESEGLLPGPPRSK